VKLKVYAVAVSVALLLSLVLLVEQRQRLARAHVLLDKLTECVKRISLENADLKDELNSRGLKK